MTTTERITAWLEPRLKLGAARELMSHKKVPVHRWTPFYFFGGMSLFFLGVQLVTGILLMLYYRPSSEGAFESVEFLMTTVPFGWLVRSVHAWSANLMVFCTFAHLGSVFFLRAFRPPREMTWISGCALLFLSLTFGFSGYLLPWNRLSFFATQVGTEIAGAVPLIGHWTLRFLRGGERVTGGTLSRFYAWHVAVLPAITFLLLVFHLLQVQFHGMSVPDSVEKEEKAGGKRREMPFVPHFALREAFGWTIALGVLGALAALFPWELGDKADPFAPAYADIRPEWYFMFMFETLKLVPGGAILGIEYEAIAIMAFGALGGLLLIVPFLDARMEKSGKAWILTLLGAIILAYAAGMTAYGYRSWLPLAGAAAPALIAWAVGKLPGGRPS